MSAGLTLTPGGTISSILSSTSVLSDVSAQLPNYRYTALYTQALDFVNAVRAYGTSLLGAIEKAGPEI